MFLGSSHISCPINDQSQNKPIWGYCRQQGPTFSHCGVGMVFSINADPYSDKSFAAFQQLASFDVGRLHGVTWKFVN